MRFADETEFSYRTVTIALVSEYHLQDAGGAPRRYDRTVRTIFRRACPDSLNACARPTSAKWGCCAISTGTARDARAKARVFGPIGMEQLRNRGGATGGKGSASRRL